jgi:hypothetical protein
MDSDFKLNNMLQTFYAYKIHLSTFNLCLHHALLSPDRGPHDNIINNTGHNMRTRDLNMIGRGER